MWWCWVACGPGQVLGGGFSSWGVSWLATIVNGKISGRFAMGQADYGTGFSWFDAWRLRWFY